MANWFQFAADLARLAADCPENETGIEMERRLEHERIPEMTPEDELRLRGLGVRL